MIEAVEPVQAVRPAWRGRAGLGLEIGAFLFGAFWIQTVPAMLGLEVDPANINGWTLFASWMVQLPLLVLLIGGLALMRGQNMRDIGLAKPSVGWWTVFWAGLAGAGVLLAGTHYFTQFLVWTGLPFETDVFIIDSWFDRLGLIMSGFAAGGFIEELVFRGYLLLRFEALFKREGKPWFGLVMAILATSLMFAVPHGYQGTGAVVEVFFVGIYLAGIVLLSKRNLWAAMATHGLYDGLLFSL